MIGCPVLLVMSLGSYQLKSPVKCNLLLAHLVFKFMEPTILTFHLDKAILQHSINEMGSGKL